MQVKKDWIGYNEVLMLYTNVKSQFKFNIREWKQFNSSAETRSRVTFSKNLVHI